jgi:hypothetical protein
MAKNKRNKKESIQERIDHVENEEFRLLGDIGHLARHIYKIKAPVISAIRKLSKRITILEEQIKELQKGK